MDKKYINKKYSTQTQGIAAVSKWIVPRHLPPTPQTTVGKILEIAIDSKQIRWAYDSYLDILEGVIRGL